MEVPIELRYPSWEVAIYNEKSHFNLYNYRLLRTSQHQTTVQILSQPGAPCEQLCLKQIAPTYKTLCNHDQNNTVSAQPAAKQIRNRFADGCARRRTRLQNKPFSSRVQTAQPGLKRFATTIKIQPVIKCNVTQ